MANILMEGFELYSEISASQVAGRGSSSDSTSSEIVTGRNGYGKGLRKNNGTSSSDFIRRPLRKNASEVFIGFYLDNLVRISGSGNYCFLYFEDSAGTFIGGFALLAGGLVYGTNGPASVTTRSTYPEVVTGTAQYIEARIVFSGSATGLVEWRQNGVAVHSDADIITGSGPAARLVIASGSSSSIRSSYDLLDDIYVNDTTDGVNDGFWGDTRIGVDFPNADTPQRDFSASGVGGNYEMLNQDPSDEDTTYTYSDTDGAEDLFELPSKDHEILAVSPIARVRKEVSGSGAVSVVTQANGTKHVSDPGAVTTAYEYVFEILDTNPATGAPWLTSGYNAARFGYRLVET